MSPNDVVNGLWTVEFLSTFNRAGKGVLVFTNGRLLGGDAGYYYSGTYTVTGNRIEGKVNVKRYDINSISIFGNMESFAISFAGEINNYSLSTVGEILDKPQYKIRLIGNKRENI